MSHYLKMVYAGLSLMPVALWATLIMVVILWLPALIMTINEAIYYVAYIRSRSGQRLGGGEISGRLSIIVPVKGESLELITELINSVSRIEWPHNNMELIIISDDDEAAFNSLKKHVAELKPTIEARLIRRERGLNGRTGALNEGLRNATGQYLLVIDVDSIVHPSFPRMAAEALKGNVAAVVSRWRGRNWDTLVSQAVSASMDFTVDSLWGGRQALGLPLYVIGSGTMFRVDALRGVGGWFPAALQDDMDMGAILMRNGYTVKFIELPTLVENPRTYSVFRFQQYKWAYGTADVLRRRFMDIMRAPINAWAKLDSTIFLMQYLAVPLLLLAVMVAGVGSIVMGIDIMRILWPLAIIHIGLLAIISFFYGDSLRRHGLSRWESSIYAGRSSAIMGALAPHLLIATIKGFMGIPINWGVTPKGGPARLRAAPLELVTAILLSLLLIINVFLSHWLMAFFILMMLLPFLYVFYRFPDESLSGIRRF